MVVFGSTRLMGSVNHTNGLSDSHECQEKDTVVQSKGSRDSSATGPSDDSPSSSCSTSGGVKSTTPTQSRKLHSLQKVSSPALPSSEAHPSTYPAASPRDTPLAPAPSSPHPANPRSGRPPASPGAGGKAVTSGAQSGASEDRRTNGAHCGNRDLQDGGSNSADRGNGGLQDSGTDSAPRGSGAVQGCGMDSPHCGNGGLQDSGTDTAHRGSQGVQEYGTDSAHCGNGGLGLERGSAGEGQGAGQGDREAGDKHVSMALLMLARGKPGEALELVESSHALDEMDAAALCVRGRCLESLNNNPGAFASYSAALQKDPSHLETLMASAALYKSCGMLEEAAGDLRCAVQAHPSNGAARRALAMVLTDLGTKLKLGGSVKAGLANYHEAIAVCACYPPAYYNIGVIFSENREYDKALEYYRLAVGAGPGYAEAHCNVGVIYKEQGRLEDAIAAYERALAAAPNFSIVHMNLAIALTELGTRAKLAGDVARGIRLYERALAHNPKHADALYNLGVAFGETNQAEKAIFMYEMAVAFNPNCVEAYNNLGVILREQGRLDKALSCYQAALQLRPNFPQGLNNLAVVFTAQGKARDALHLLQAALSACPMYAEAYNNLGVLQRDVGAIQDAIASYEKCMALQPASRSASQNRLLALNYIYAGDDPLLCAAHEEWGRNFARTVTRLPEVRPPQDVSSSERALVVGYVSPDFLTHSVSYFAEAPLSHHNPARVRHIAYNCVAKGDARTGRLREAVEEAGGTWRDVAHLSEESLAALVHDDGVDILVDLTGHTANNRLGTLAMRPAPIQVTWIGYPNSTGLQSVDYRLTDALADPLDTQQTFTEELVRLPGCFLCYTPPPEAPPVAPTPSALAGFVTFGSFNALAKMTPQVLRVWARILQAVPNSRLLLKNKPFACVAARQHFLNQLEAEGVARGRVDLLPLQAATGDHLGMYCHLDISLDPFPYAGTTTTCESLYMGVPCITLAGGGHAHNVGVSLLTAVGLGPDWVARSEEEYVQLAVRHAADLAGLAALRETLRERMLSSRLCDAPAFVADLEDVYHDLYERWVGGSGDVQRNAEGQGEGEGSRDVHQGSSCSSGEGLRADELERGV